jgi:ankyrin repeat protein
VHNGDQQTMRELEQGLFEAISSKNITKINAYLTQGAKVNIRNAKGQTPLILATQLNFLPAIKALVANGNVSPSHPEGPPNYNTAMTYAISKDDNDDHKAVIDCLFSHPKLSDNDLELAFIYYAKTGNLQKIKECIEERYVDINYNHDFYSTALHNAIANEKLEIVQELLSNQNINTNSLNELHESPIILAIKTGNTEIFHLLLKRIDLNLYKQSYLLGTPLTAAIHLKKYDFAKELLKKEEKFFDKLHPGAVLCAIRNGAIDILKLLIEKGANVNSTGQEGYEEPPSSVWEEKQSSAFFNPSGKSIFELPLILALQTNQPNLVTLLINSNADKNKKGTSGIAAADLMNNTSLEAPLSSVPFASEKIITDFYSKPISQKTIPQIEPPQFEANSLKYYLEWVTKQEPSTQKAQIKKINDAITSTGFEIKMPNSQIDSSFSNSLKAQKT